MDFEALPVASRLEAPEGAKLVPVSCLGELRARFATMAKRCVSRLKGCAAPTMEVVARGTYTHTWEVRGDEGERITRSRDLEAVWVRVDGQQPKLAGWSLAARLERLATDERMVRNVPGVEIPARFRDTGYTCEHCNAARDRKDCFVVVNEAGEFKQVGASCLKDFLGHNPAAMLKFFSNFGGMCDEFGEWIATGMRLPNVIDTLEVLQYAAAAIRVHGWVSRKAADAYYEKSDGQNSLLPTSRIVHACISPGTENDHRTRKALKPTEADEKLAAETLAWVRGWEDTKSDYELNLKIALKHDVMDPRTIAIAVSAPASMLRYLSREAELGMKRKEAANSNWRGELKERLHGIQAKISFVKHGASDFGSTTLIKFVADNGDILTWFASGHHQVKPGDAVILTGTVKRHTEYNGAKETQLSRCLMV